MMRLPNISSIAIISLALMNSFLFSSQFLRLFKTSVSDEHQQLNATPKHPAVKPTDRIYSEPYPKHSIYPPPFPLLSPIVVEEYKLVFFPLPKVASSEWKRLFARMNKNEHWCEVDIHKPEKNKLNLLRHYNASQASDMMTNPEWTRAIFVREPKERLLSAFLDKSILQWDNFEKKFCHRYRDFGGNLEECLSRHRDFDFFLTNFTQIAPNVHWEPIYRKIDPNWWNYINFIGYMPTMHSDSRRLLKRLYSIHDGRSAWDRWGTAGWPDNVTQHCNKTNGEWSKMKQYEFMKRPDATHSTNAKTRKSQYYTPRLESFVEEKWAEDYNNSFYQFRDHRIFPRTMA